MKIFFTKKCIVVNIVGDCVSLMPDEHGIQRVVLVIQRDFREEDADFVVTKNFARDFTRLMSAYWEMTRYGNMAWHSVQIAES